MKNSAQRETARRRTPRNGKAGEPWLSLPSDTAHRPGLFDPGPPPEPDPVLAPPETPPGEKMVVPRQAGAGAERARPWSAP